MGHIRRVESVIPFCAIISRRPHAFDWSRRQLTTLWGPLAETSEPMPFEASGYYTREMGTGLSKILVAAVQPRDPAELARWKTATNRLEAEYAALQRRPEPGQGEPEQTEPEQAEAGQAELRPLNLDPGYISQSKLVLATVKDRDHRLYLSDGIFAEVTLRYLRSGWTDNPWTYPDYRTAPVKTFANECRARLRRHLAARDGWRR